MSNRELTRHVGSLHRSERGAAIVEFAIVLVLFMMIVFGTITFGITHNDNLSIETAARETARFAATYPVADAGSDEAWLRAVAQAAEDAAAGALDPGVDNRSICVALGSGSDSGGFTRLTVTGSTATSSGSAVTGWCYANSAPSDDPVVQVAVRRNGWIQVVVFEVNPTLTAQATNRFERLS